MKFAEFVKKVAQFEGYSSIPYKCPAGYLTIGYGKRIKASEVEKYESLSKIEMYEIFYSDLSEIQTKVRLQFPIDTPYANIDDIILAITDFVYNCGFTALNSSTTALGNYFRKITTSSASYDDLYQFSSVLLRYCHVGKKPLKGLQRRRLFEFRLLMYP